MRRAALAAALLGVAVAAAGARPECAHACSCLQLEPERALADAQAAFVGTLVERREAAGGSALLVFDVDRRLKGPLGDRVTVATPDSGASCGIEADAGARLALFLTRSGGTWQGSLCSSGPAEVAASLPTAASGDEVADSFAEATAWFLAVLVLGGIGVFLLRRRFRPD